jgi:hypothetical protein
MTINNLVFDGKHSATVDVRAPNIPVADFLNTVPIRRAFQLWKLSTAHHQYKRCRRAGACRI